MEKGRKIKKWFKAEQRNVAPKEEHNQTATFMLHALDNENTSKQPQILRKENMTHASHVHQKETKTDDQSSNLTCAPLKKSSNAVDSFVKVDDDYPVIEHQSLSTNYVKNNVDLSILDTTPSK